MCAPLSTLALSLLKKVKVHNKDVSPRFPETPDMLDALKMAAIVPLNWTTIVKYAQNALSIQGDFFNWPPPEFAKCWPVSN